jgi:hypothetical protein
LTPNRLPITGAQEASESPLRARPC